MEGWGVGRMIRVSDLRSLDVVNTLDGRRLGSISDLEVDLNAGRVTGVIIPGPARVLGLFARNGEIYIPWEKIDKIGTDVILVSVPSSFMPHDRY
jgi:YlmC/YmxH family sporulation protein